MKLLALLLTLPLCAQPPQRDIKLEAPRKVALVIGNGNYPKWPLRNPANDARAVSQALSEIGFATTTAVDVTLQNLDRAVSALVSRIRPGDVVAFYYAGHGIQLEGENYLVPVDFDAKDEADAKYAAYAASRVQERIEKAGARVTLVVLDACRNNPFAATRSANGGLAAMGSGKGTLIAFATAPGKTADDNPNGNNGLFTSHLVTALKEPGLTLDQVFNRVRERVHNASGGRQVPWTVSSVIGDVYLRPGPGGTAPALPPPPASETVAVARPPVQNPLARIMTNSVAPVERPQDPVPDLAAGNAAYQRGDTQQAARIAQEILRGEPNHREALLLLAYVHFREQQWELFAATAVQALRAGATLPFSVGHHHTLTGAHAASLTVSRDLIQYQITGGNCTGKNFSLPLANLVAARATSNTQGVPFLSLKINDENGKTQNFNFVDPTTEVRDNPNGLPLLISPPRAARFVQAIAAILNQTRQP
ncbi:MAG: caspase family protein [Acidobacteria bacterium]|jgi:hypothetical protein|nr:caspase family protein [Acidobacteriota bacterium]